MNPHRTVTAVIGLRLDTAAPEGVLMDSEGGARPFHGWLELAGAIEGWRTEAAAGAEPRTDEGGTR